MFGLRAVGPERPPGGLGQVEFVRPVETVLGGGEGEQGLHEAFLLLAGGDQLLAGAT